MRTNTIAKIISITFFAAAFALLTGCGFIPIGHSIQFTVQLPGDLPARVAEGENFTVSVTVKTADSDTVLQTKTTTVSKTGEEAALTLDPITAGSSVDIFIEIKDSESNLAASGESLAVEVSEGETSVDIEYSLETYTVTFDPYEKTATDATATTYDFGSKPFSYGSKFIAPTSSDENFPNLIWYTTEELTAGTEWDFDNDIVTKDMTLYAKEAPAT